MSASVIIATTDGIGDQRRIAFAPAPTSDTDDENDHPENCHCVDCRSPGKVSASCHCSACHNHQERHPSCKCHCPDCHQCERGQCGCHCDYCHKCDACTEDCQCFYCYDETGVCLECDEDCEFCQNGDHDLYCGCDYCTRRAVLNGTFHKALVPGAMTNKHESNYTHQPRPRTAVKHSRRFLYDHSTAKELRDFVRARGLQDPYPGGLTLKHSYVRILEAADRSPPNSFRFLDLPPEIRALIYGDLLDLDARDAHTMFAKIHTQILQTCRLVCREGTDVLYSNSPVLCGVIATEIPSAPGEILYRAARVRHYVEETFLNERFVNESLWPIFLKRVRHIRLVILLHDWTFEEEDWLEFEDEDGLDFSEGLRFIEEALRRLTKLTAETKQLKKLEVFFEVDEAHEESVEDEDIQRALSPLRRLRNLKTFTLIGDVPDGLSDSIAQTITSTD